jgi:hypothetical protein
MSDLGAFENGAVKSAMGTVYVYLFGLLTIPEIPNSQCRNSDGSSKESYRLSGQEVRYHPHYAEATARAGRRRVEE